MTKELKGPGFHFDVHTDLRADQKAEVLIEALPWLEEFAGQRIVIKYGGSAMISRELREAVIGDVILLSLVGIHVVVVHGGGPEISEMLKKLGHESRFVDGLRYTDAETMDVVQSVLCGKVNKNLVAQLNRLGGQAIGLCGMDGQLFQAEQLDEKYGLVGKITGVNPEPVENALLSGYIPVVSTVAQGVDADTAYNINADTAASKLAAAMGAEKLILLTDVRGLLRNPRDEETLIHVVHTYDVPGLVAQGIISGGMIPKMECCVDAIAGGKSLETSMGFTPLAGLPMGTRAGDIDAGILEYLMNKYGYSIGEMLNILNKKSGMEGISGVSSDFRDLEEGAEKGNERCALAREKFAYEVKKLIGAYAAVMGGVDAIIFTAGVGENDALERMQIASGLEYMGVKMDEDANNVRGEERVISATDSKVKVLLIPTNEELMIAMDTASLVG